ncbi:D-aminoacyl-tRNA deacylase [Alicyclobacillus mali (ex Roth et al. 2021)]|uniref:D-aminoacyl-tRNA deacylase n=1 Tax=Alicyclobacillus mali (ex Roth et al. 2021) TaxID=1123961 RepID=UPI0008295901|nr:D-aminoacyl-tRNA deacylase [Alicyclobacillus mali (ex Roth et al. 2021)]MCL6487980.1 D-tyrosyl-tRNA(Tyr) deacylase [Alicyclobacillus mali (ex Roth et al. 2021)]
MRVVVQRSGPARVRVDGEIVGEIDFGLVLLVGVGKDDGPEDVRYLADKIAGLRIFPDEDGKLNRDVREVGGAVLSVSQFTLYGDARKGRRPSYADAAPPEMAESLYDALNDALRAEGLRVETGRFRAMMQVELVNDGPVTILLDSKRQF